MFTTPSIRHTDRLMHTAAAHLEASPRKESSKHTRDMTSTQHIITATTDESSLNEEPDDEVNGEAKNDKRNWHEKLRQYGWALLSVLLIALTFMALLPTRRSDNDDGDDRSADSQPPRNKNHDDVAVTRTANIPEGPPIPTIPVRIMPTDTASTARAYLSLLKNTSGKDAVCDDLAPDEELFNRIDCESTLGDVRLHAPAFTAYLADFWAHRARDVIHGKTTWSARMIEAQQALPRSNFRVAAAKHQAIIDHVRSTDRLGDGDRGERIALQAHALSVALFMYTEAFSANSIRTNMTPAYIENACRYLKHHDFDALPESAQTTARNLLAHAERMLTASLPANSADKGKPRTSDEGCTAPDSSELHNGLAAPAFPPRELMDQAWNIGMNTPSHSTLPQPQAMTGRATVFTPNKPLR